MINAIITGSGHFLPPNVIKNNHFLNHQFYDEDGNKITKPNQEIIEKFQEITEIEERRYADEDMTNTQMAAIAGKKALDDAGIDKESLDYVIVASNYGDITVESQQSNFLPSISAGVKNLLDIRNTSCKPYDMVFGCPGYLESLILGTQFIKAGLAKKILIIGSEMLSRAIDKYDRSAMIFADGAGAAVLEAKEGPVAEGVIHHKTLSHNNDELNYLSNSSSLNKDSNPHTVNISMKGRKVYEYALKNVPTALKQILDEAEVGIEDVDKILLHQANAKMDHAMVARLFKLFNVNKPDGIDPMTVQLLGNSSVATIPTMFDLIAKKQLEGHAFYPGNKIILGSVGGGMNINGVLYKFPQNK